MVFFGPVIVWTIRLACLLYVLAVAAWLTRRYPRPFWTTGCLFYLAHVVAAFSLHHHWSHDSAYRETARRTAEMFGVESGAGVYFNYLLTIVWAGDVSWMWLDAAGYHARPRWITVAVQTFMAFMFFNGTVVFASGWIRWAGALATLSIVILWRYRSKD